jgi:hypothetical protein
MLTSYIDDYTNKLSIDIQDITDEDRELLSYYGKYMVDLYRLPFKDIKYYFPIGLKYFLETSENELLI